MVKLKRLKMQQSREDYKDLMCTMETRFNYRIHSLENMSVSAKLAPPTLKIQNSGYTIIYRSYVVCGCPSYYTIRVSSIDIKTCMGISEANLTIY